MPAANAVLAALHERRSIRRFTEEPLSREDLLAILEAVRWAPSGGNRQPWRLLALFPGDPRKEAVAAFSKYTRILTECQATILMALDRETCYDPVKDCQVAGAGLQNLLLAAHSLGLGAVWIGDTVSMGPEVLEAAGLDADKLQFMAVVAVGHPAETGTAKRRDMNEFMLEPI